MKSDNLLLLAILKALNELKLQYYKSYLVNLKRLIMKHLPPLPSN